MRLTAFASLIVLLPSALAAQSGAAANAVDQTIRRAQAAWADVRTLRATFEQSITNPITGSAMLARGELQQQKPNMLAINFSDPAGDAIVADGKHVWIYIPSATPGQVVKMTNAQAGAPNTDLIGQFLDTPRDAYDATDAGVDTVSGRAARVVILTAKPGQQLPFIRAKVWVDAKDGLIRRFESTDPSGISRSVRLLALKPNAAVEKSAFVFKVPKGARVVTP